MHTCALAVCIKLHNYQEGSHSKLIAGYRACVYIAEFMGFVYGRYIFRQIFQHWHQKTPVAILCFSVKYY